MKIIMRACFQYIYSLYLRQKQVVYGKDCIFNGWGHIYNAGTIQLGEKVRINSGLKYNPIGGSTKNILRVYSGARLEIGNNVGVSNSAIIANKRITIGNNVLIGGNCKIYDSDFHPLCAIDRMEKNVSTIRTKEITIHDNVFIGAHCIILKGTEIKFLPAKCM